MKINELTAALEAVLFAGGEPVEATRLCEIFEIDDETLSKVATLLQNKLAEKGSGIQLLRLADCYQLASRKEYAEYVKKAFDIRRKTPLSQAALEVLTVIAYNQPVTKAFVEQVRGVDCSGVISTLVEKDLITEKGRLELPGRPLLYGTTATFLRAFSLSSLKDLPELPQELEGGAEQLTMDDVIEEQAQAENN